MSCPTSRSPPRLSDVLDFLAHRWAERVGLLRGVDTPLGLARSERGSTRPRATRERHASLGSANKPTPWVLIPPSSRSGRTCFAEAASQVRRLAERVGFEPTVPLIEVRRFSKPLLSTTQAPLRTKPSGQSVRAGSPGIKSPGAPRPGAPAAFARRALERPSPVRPSPFAAPAAPPEALFPFSP